MDDAADMAEPMDQEGPEATTSESPYDELLAAPVSQAQANGRRARRTAEYIAHDERFVLSEKKYTQQYAQIYFQRLMLLRRLMEQRVSKQWPNLPVRKILSLEEEVDCCVIGTLYKEMALKPCILDDYLKDRSIAPLVKGTKFVKPDDALHLEDESGRMRLIGAAIDTQTLVSGIVIAVRGREKKGGDFEVSEVLLPELPPQPPLPSPGKDAYVAIVSGLGLGGATASPLHAQLLVDYLTGHLGSPQEQAMSARIVRVIVAGDSLGTSVSSVADPVIGPKVQSQVAAQLQEADLTITQLAAAMPIDVLPGSNDPANYSLPQQPLHPCLFQAASHYSSYLAVTNPHECDIGGVRFLGTSGQNVDDIWKYSAQEDRLALMELTLQARHLAPTAPDTLACYPFADREPFIIETCPHVYYTGNQPSFATKKLMGLDGQETRIVLIPRFDQSGTVVLVNLATLKCHPVTFSTALAA
eukprot:jgi/Chlat1/2653/Chrsp178S02503